MDFFSVVNSQEFQIFPMTEIQNFKQEASLGPFKYCIINILTLLDYTHPVIKPY